MTKTQRAILLIGLVLFLISASFPPWREYQGAFGPFAPLTFSGQERLDIHRLLVEWLIIVVTVGVLLLLTMQKESE